MVAFKGCAHSAMPAIPHENLLDHSIAFLADPYRFISRKCREHECDVFETRIMLKRTLCMSGPAAAELFYDKDLFQRGGAPPEPLSATLFGKGGVQGLDGEAHLRRKALFMRACGPQQMDRLREVAAIQWERAAYAWAAEGAVVLYDAFRELLARTVCLWAGVPLAEAEVAERTRQLTELFDEAAAPGLGHLRSRFARKQAEQWIGQVIRDIRAGRLALSEQSPAFLVAWHRDGDDLLLPPRIAAVELLNLLRPTVAVSVFLVAVAHALHLYPQLQARLEQGERAFAEAFVQEVRRWYPFFPVVAAVVRRDFEWEGYAFPAGRRAMLDLYGTDHDPRTWRDPEVFRPERFITRQPTLFDFIPQGGGEAASNHRCPGEGITVALMRQAADFLVHRLRYAVPPQDLHIDYGRLPALPRDRMRIYRILARF